MTTLEIRNAKLDEAKALILRGWYQGRPSKMIFDDGRPAGHEVCAYGAVTNDMGKFDADAAAMASAWRALTAALAKLDLGTSVIRYNDAPGRTKHEVAALFDHAKEMPL